MLIPTIGGLRIFNSSGPAARPNLPIGPDSRRQIKRCLEYDA